MLSCLPWVPPTAIHVSPLRGDARLVGLRRSLLAMRKGFALPELGSLTQSGPRYGIEPAAGLPNPLIRAIFPPFGPGGAALYFEAHFACTCSARNVPSG